RVGSDDPATHRGQGRRGLHAGLLQQQGRQDARSRQGTFFMGGPTEFAQILADGAPRAPSRGSCCGAWPPALGRVRSPSAVSVITKSKIPSRSPSAPLNATLAVPVPAASTSRAGQRGEPAGEHEGGEPVPGLPHDRLVHLVSSSLLPCRRRLLVTA